MNTERDNFHDWARDKPDTTSSAPLSHWQTTRRATPAGPSIWLRLAQLGIAMVVLGVAYRLFFK